MVYIINDKMKMQVIESKDNHFVEIKTCTCVSCDLKPPSSYGVYPFKDNVSCAKNSFFYRCFLCAGDFILCLGFAI